MSLWTPEQDARLTEMAGRAPWTEVAARIRSIRPTATTDAVKGRAKLLGLSGQGTTRRICVRGHDTDETGRYANRACRQCTWQRNHSAAYLAGEATRRQTPHYLQRYTTWRIRRGNTMKYGHAVDRALAALGM